MILVGVIIGIILFLLGVYIRIIAPHIEDNILLPSNQSRGFYTYNFETDLKLNKFAGSFIIVAGIYLLLLSSFLEENTIGILLFGTSLILLIIVFEIVGRVYAWFVIAYDEIPPEVINAIVNSRKMNFRRDDVVRVSDSINISERSIILSIGISLLCILIGLWIPVSGTQVVSDSVLIALFSSAFITVISVYNLTKILFLVLITRKNPNASRGVLYSQFNKALLEKDILRSSLNVLIVTIAIVVIQQWMDFFYPFARTYGFFSILILVLGAIFFTARKRIKGSNKLNENLLELIMQIKKEQQREYLKSRRERI
ncbi:MAG: hypothetical protein ACP6IU_10730 [Candidatus Asgardarchaeia archaeon]